MKLAFWVLVGAFINLLRHGDLAPIALLVAVPWIAVGAWGAVAVLRRMWAAPTALAFCRAGIAGVTSVVLITVVGLAGPPIFGRPGWLHFDHRGVTFTRFFSANEAELDELARVLGPVASSAIPDLGLNPNDPLTAIAQVPGIDASRCAQLIDRLGVTGLGGTRQGDGVRLVVTSGDMFSPERGLLISNRPPGTTLPDAVPGIGVPIDVNDSGSLGASWWYYAMQVRDD